MKLSGEEQKKIQVDRHAMKSLVPEQYHSASTSSLSYEIVEGTQTHDMVVPE